MIDIGSEDILTLSEAGRAVPPKGVSPACMARWITTGVRGVVLETVRVGGRRLTSKEALARFFAAQNRDESAMPTVTPSQRRRQAVTADRLLAEAGL